MGTAVTTLYRAVSEAEYQQIVRTGRFELMQAAEGKYFWELLSDATEFAGHTRDPHIIRVSYSTQVAATFDVMPAVDAIGVARFAPENKMNRGLLEIVLQWIPKSDGSS